VYEIATKCEVQFGCSPGTNIASVVDERVSSDVRMLICLSAHARNVLET